MPGQRSDSKLTNNAPNTLQENVTSPQNQITNSQFTKQLGGNINQTASDSINNAMDYNARAYGGDSVSSGKGGNIRYTLDANGNVIRSNAANGEIAPLQSRVTSGLRNPNEQPFRITRENTGYPGGGASVGFEQIKQAIDSGQMTPSQGLAYWSQLNATPEQQQAAMQQAQIQNLINTAVDPGEDGSLSGIGRAKRTRRGAIGVLNQLGQMRKEDQENQYRMRGLDINQEQARLGQQSSESAAQRDQMNKDREYQLNVAKERAAMSKPIALGGGQAWSEPAGAVLTQPQRLVAYNPETGEWGFVGENQGQDRQQQAYTKAQEILANPNNWDEQYVQNAKAIVEQMRGNYQ